MYEAFYGLREKPFNLTPDPRFLFLSEKHKEAFAHLMFGIKNRGGFVMVTGEIGTGKTTICRTLLNRLDDDTEVAFIFNPCLSPDELLRTINQDFGIRTRAATIKGLIDELNQYLLDRRSRNKNCVLVIDEAQNLEPAVLEQIRLLSNLETETEKLLQIVLIGQPELGEILELPELRQLNQRITARYHLRELNFDETLQYVAYRLRVAGGRRKVRFTRGAIRRVYRASGGVPRVINAICDRALLVGYTLESRDITSAIVRRAAREVRGERVGVGPRRPLWRRAIKPLAAAAVLAAVLGGVYYAAPQLEGLITRFAAAETAAAGTAPEAATAPVETTTEPVETAAAAPAETPQPEQTPAPAAEDLTKYEALLDGLQPDASREAAARAILERWGRTSERVPANDADLVRWASALGMNAETLYPSLQQLEAIDLPAFAVILTKDLQPVWVGIVGKDSDRLQVVTGPGQTEWIPRSVLEKRYQMQAVVPWVDPRPGQGVLAESDQGEYVRALQDQLVRMGRLKSAATGTYDPATVTAVRLVQHETGLTVDGKVGRQTRMVLSSWSGEPGVVRLSQAKEHAAAVAAAAAAEEPAPQGAPPSDGPVTPPADTPLAAAEPPAEAPATEPAAETPPTEAAAEASVPAAEPPAEAAPEPAAEQPAETSEQPALPAADAPVAAMESPAAPTEAAEEPIESPAPPADAPAPAAETQAAQPGLSESAVLPGVTGAYLDQVWTYQDLAGGFRPGRGVLLDKAPAAAEASEESGQGGKESQ